MKIEFSIQLRDLYGTTLTETDPVTRKEKALTLGSVIANALLAPYPDEQGLTADEKVSRFRLAVSVVGGGQDFSVDDVSLMKRLVAKAYAPLIVGRVCEIIESSAE